MFGTLGGPELFLIFVVALIVFGPRKLPEIGKSLGKMMAEFRKASNEFRNTIESEVEAEKIRDSMRLEPPKVESVSPAAVAPPPTVTPVIEPAPDAVPTAPNPAPEVTSVPAPERAGDPLPETVSRQPAPAPIEPR
jgi:Tat protein translocase TatB subunit